MAFAPKFLRCWSSLSVQKSLSLPPHHFLCSIMAMGDLQAVIDQQQAEIAQLNQQNNELRLQLSRSRSSSTTSGKKRPAPVGWEVIIYALHGIDDKDRVLSTLEAMKSPEEFIQLNLEGKKNFVEMIGLTDWEDAITKQIGEVCVLYVCVE